MEVAAEKCTSALILASGQAAATLPNTRNCFAFRYFGWNGCGRSRWISDWSKHVADDTWCKFFRKLHGSGFLTIYDGTGADTGCEYPTLQATRIESTQKEAPQLRSDLSIKSSVKKPGSVILESSSRLTGMEQRLRSNSSPTDQCLSISSSASHIRQIDIRHTIWSTCSN